MSKVKLYTEEHLKIFYHLGKIDGFIGRQDDVDELIKNYPPIELPSDEEIEEKCNSLDGYEFDSHESAFFGGAKCIINEIQGGNNEQH